MPFKTKATYIQEAEQAKGQLQILVGPELSYAPKLDWNEVSLRFIRYLYEDVRDTPWLNHLVFLALVLSSYIRLDQKTVEARIYMLNARWRILFPKYKITAVEDWNPAVHFRSYLNDTELSDAFSTKQHFLTYYYATSGHLAAYIRSLPTQEQKKYQCWLLPSLPAEVYRAISQAATLVSEQRQRRKEETDALSSHFARIRGEGHLRWNQLKRLRDKYREAVAFVQSGQEVLPLTFTYEEPNLEQRLHFRLWDRYSFFDYYANQYSYVAKSERKRLVRGFASEKNHFFLEFLHAEHLQNGTYDARALLWFDDLLRLELLGSSPGYGSKEEVQQKQAYLRDWGYGEEGEEIICPFRTNMPGLLSWSASQERFLQEAQQRTSGRVFVVEPFFAAATFGLAALDFFTTTGARNGELIQLSLDAGCLYTLEVEGVQRFLVRLVPKNSEKVADYVVGAETQRNLERVGDLLQEHYQLHSGESIPQVMFNTRDQQSHRFKEPRAYLFQYNKKHFSEYAVNACLRFLMYGLVFQTMEGKTVTLKAHALRHLFATHLHHVEAVPLDVIAVMLHQKNVQVTAYYAAPPWQQVLSTANSLLDKFATHLGAIEDAFVRAPAELQRQLEEAKAQVGSLNKIPGGNCTCHAICPISFACTGCVYNVPDPDREEEIVEQEQWAFIRLDQVKKRSQGPEIVKMQALLQRCGVTRQEMQLIRTYRKDEVYVPTIAIERNKQGSEQAETVVAQTLRGETTENDYPRPDCR